MVLCLNLILQKTAFRLYKAPRNSQLLKRPGGAWHTPIMNDLPLLAPNRASLMTTLKMLATRVPENGPRIDPFPKLPQGAPHWNRKIQVMPKQKEWDYKTVIDTLTTECWKGTITNIYCSGVLSNKECTDKKQIGATSTVLY